MSFVLKCVVCPLKQVDFILPFGNFLNWYLNAGSYNPSFFLLPYSCRIFQRSISTFKVNKRHYFTVVSLIPSKFSSVFSNGFKFSFFPHVKPEEKSKELIFIFIFIPSSGKRKAVARCTFKWLQHMQHIFYKHTH